MNRAWRGLRGFLDDEDGTASMEFVVALPLLLGPLVIFAEYGEALSKREQLDSAVADAVQLLANSPAWPGATEADPPQLYQPFVNRAATLIAERLGTSIEDINFAYTVTGDLSNGALRTPFYQVSVSAQITLNNGMLSFINAFTSETDVATVLTLPSRDTARYISAVPPIENTGCTFADLATNCSSTPADVIAAPENYTPPTQQETETAESGQGDAG
ncbi:MAG: hypothetical protein AAGC57_00265 [Pseudomonadota bacterium]